MMCRRFEILCSLKIFAKIFNIGVTSIRIEQKPNYNVAPTNEIFVVTQNEHCHMVQCRRGFVSPWSTDQSRGCTVINVQAESVMEKQGFRKAFTQQRRLIQM